MLNVSSDFLCSLFSAMFYVPYNVLCSLDVLCSLNVLCSLFSVMFCVPLMLNITGNTTENIEQHRENGILNIKGTQHITESRELCSVPRYIVTNHGLFFWSQRCGKPLSNPLEVRHESALEGILLSSSSRTLDGELESSILPSSVRVDRPLLSGRGFC